MRTVSIWLVAAMVFVAIPLAQVAAEIRIEPPQPTDVDAIEIAVSGSWANPCFDVSSSVSVDGRHIAIDVTITPHNVICIQILGFWSVQHTVGPLAAGAYDVVVNLDGIASERTTLRVRAAAAVAASGCVGDCNGDNHVTIDELLRGVALALGEQPSESCEALELPVGIADLVEAVGNALAGCATPCGDGVATGSEQCDDGNTVGGDGCAVNCSAETTRACAIDAERSTLTALSVSFPIAAHPSGILALVTGAARNGSNVRAALQDVIPLVVRSDGLRFEPLKLLGTGCICLRAVEDRAFGAGNAGDGGIQCGAAERGSAQIDLRLSAVALRDAGVCDTSGPRLGGGCPYADYGPDCLPCTEDDARAGTPMSLELATDVTGGSRFDCDVLAANPSAGLGSGTLVTSWTDPALGDVTLTLACLEGAAPSAPGRGGGAQPRRHLTENDPRSAGAAASAP